MKAIRCEECGDYTDGLRFCDDCYESNKNKLIVENDDEQ